MGRYFGTDGFRGEANVTLTADHAYKVGRFLGWSIYPLVSLGMIGAFLIFLAIYRPARELMERKFFI